MPFVNAIAAGVLRDERTEERAFVGPANFRFLLEDPNFHTAVLEHDVFALASVCVQLPLAWGWRCC